MTGFSGGYDSPHDIQPFCVSCRRPVGVTEPTTRLKGALYHDRCLPVVLADRAMEVDRITADLMAHVDRVAAQFSSRRHNPKRTPEIRHLVERDLRAYVDKMLD